MNARTKNICILLVLSLFLLMISLMPVTCLIYQVTGIYCPSCGMTRAFYSILHFQFIDAFNYNILSIPLFVFIIVSVFSLLYEIFKNKFTYISNLLNILSKKPVIFIILFLLLISFILNNI